MAEGLQTEAAAPEPAHHHLEVETRLAGLPRDLDDIGQALDLVQDADQLAERRDL